MPNPAATIDSYVDEVRRIAAEKGVPVRRLSRDDFMAATTLAQPTAWKSSTTWHELKGRAESGAQPVQSTPPPAPFSFTPVPDEDVSVEELITHRKRQFARKAAHEEARRLIPINVELDGPIGILFFGDPHVDDDGTDLAALERHTEICRTTEGMFAANLGDTTNNWVGRLARLYAEQSTSAKQAWMLAEWFVRRVDWLFMVAGNHDCFSGAGDPIKWMVAQGTTLHQASEARIELRFPNGKAVRVNARHEFAGNSQWNPAHGSMKAAQFGTNDHILVNGHRHVSGYGVIKDPDQGVISHCIQVASYKVYDRYARERGFRDQHISPCAVAVIDPDASEAGTVQVFWEPEAAAEFLTWKRSRSR